MRRADRLFAIVQFLRGGRLVTARKLAERLEVSERTIYRDVADLQASGVPIEGEAGVGYVLRQGFTLPPLMFTADEIAALRLGARLVRAWGGARMALAAEEALVKIEAVLPETHRDGARDTRLYALGLSPSDEVRRRLDALDEAIAARRRLSIAYTRLDDAASERTVRPLGLYHWGRVWTLIAWCELRADFRVFRIDRIGEVEDAGPFRHESGRTLRDYLRRLAETGAIPAAFRDQPGARA
jgi:predicted DNA-binding transcriptional regulator YafY